VFSLGGFEIVQISEARIQANAFLYVLKCTIYAIGKKFWFNIQK